MMTKLTPSQTLKESIRLLEIRQQEEGQILKAQFKITYESLKLVNLIKSTFSEITDSKEVKNGFLETVVTILTGYLTKKMMFNSKQNPLMKIFSVLLQFVVTNFVSKNMEGIREYFNNLIDKLLHPKDDEEDDHEIISEPEISEPKI